MNHLEQQLVRQTRQARIALITMIFVIMLFVCALLVNIVANQTDIKSPQTSILVVISFLFAVSVTTIFKTLFYQLRATRLRFADKKQSPDTEEFSDVSQLTFLARISIISVGSIFVVWVGATITLVCVYPKTEFSGSVISIALVLLAMVLLLPTVLVTSSASHLKHVPEENEPTRQTGPFGASLGDKGEPKSSGRGNSADVSSKLILIIGLVAAIGGSGITGGIFTALGLKPNSDQSDRIAKDIEEIKKTVGDIQLKKTGQ